MHMSAEKAARIDDSSGLRKNICKKTRDVIADSHNLEQTWPEFRSSTCNH